jgi:hypothetical protein
MADEGSLVGGVVDNVIATLPGSSPAAGAVVVMAHYDSVSTGPGVGDDGAAVAAMLEVARVLRAGPPLVRDVIFVASDGEEAGLLGARAFVRRYGARVDTLLNFDGRGNAGLVLLFELRGVDAAALRLLARDVPSVYATSVSGEVYRRMPNDSDFTAFRGLPVRALNFGHVGGLMRYHTPLDDLAHLDVRTLQQQGDVMLGAARAFGTRATPSGDAGGDAVPAIAFTVPWLGLVAYSSRAALPLGLASLAAAVATALLYYRRGNLRPSRVALAMVTVPLASAVAGGVAWAAWETLLRVHPSYSALPQEDVYGHDAYMLGLVALSAAVAVLPLDALARVATSRERDVGALLMGAILATVAAIVAPGVSYLFHVAVLVSVVLLATLETLCSARRRPFGLLPRLVTRIASAAPVVLLFAPIVQLTGLSMAFAHPALVGALAAFPIAHLASQAIALGLRGSPFSLASTLIAGLSIVAGARASRFDGDHPYPSSVVYVEADGPSPARWVSSLPRGAPSSASLDPWESSLVSPIADPEALLDVMPAAAAVQMREGPAAPRHLVAPTSLITSDGHAGDERVLSLRVRTARTANVVSLHLTSDRDLRAIVLADRAFTARDLLAAGCDPRDLSIAYWAPPAEGLDVTIRIPADAHLRLRTSDAVLGPVSPDASSPRRLVATMPVPYGYGLSDATVTTSTTTP